MTKKSKRQSFKMTDEHKALRELRLSKNLSLEEASRPLGIKSKALGHIENGRIILVSDRIDHIVRSLGFNRDDFEKYFNAEITRDVIVDSCTQKILDLSDEKLSLIKGIIDSMR